MWDLLESGTQPMPSTLAGGCLPSTLAFYIIVEPLGEPQRYLLKLISVRPSLAKIVSSLSSLSILLSCFTFPHSICHLWTQRLWWLAAISPAPGTFLNEHLNKWIQRLKENLGSNWTRIENWKTTGTWGSFFPKGEFIGPHMCSSLLFFSHLLFWHSSID